MTLLKSTSLVLILGSLTFLAASFSTNPQVYMEFSAAVRLAIIQEARQTWNTVNFFYAAGAVVSALAAVGIVFSLPNRSFLHILLTALAFIGGAIFFSLYVNFRVSTPETWVQIPPPHPLFLAYTLLTQAGLLVFGTVLLQTKIMPALGWTLVGGALLLFILTLIFRDMPPLTNYLLTLAAGAGLFRRSRHGKTILEAA